MARVGLNYLFRYNYGDQQRLIAKFFNDKPLFIIKTDYCGYYRANNQVVWVFYTHRSTRWQSIRIYVNKKLEIEYNSSSLEVYLKSFSILYIYDRKEPFLSQQFIVYLWNEQGWNVIKNSSGWEINGIQQKDREISRDPIKGIIDIYHWILHGRAFSSLRKHMKRRGVTII